jgi:hypothetical protein
VGLSLYVQLLGSAYDFFGPKISVCVAYEKLRKVHPELAPCDGEAFGASIVVIQHYLLWNVSRDAGAERAYPEFPWVDRNFEPTVAEAVLTQARVKSRVNLNFLFFGLPERPHVAIVTVRALLMLLVAGLTLLVVQRFRREPQGGST